MGKQNNEKTAKGKCDIKGKSILRKEQLLLSICECCLSSNKYKSKHKNDDTGDRGGNYWINILKKARKDGK
jgi:hypothetical protein